jgi:hypothetical protein
MVSKVRVLLNVVLKTNIFKDVMLIIHLSTLQGLTASVMRRQIFFSQTLIQEFYGMNMGFVMMLW